MYFKIRSEMYHTNLHRPSLNSFSSFQSTYLIKYWEWEFSRENDFNFYSMARIIDSRRADGETRKKEQETMNISANISYI